MTRITHELIKAFLKDLGLELKRVREAKNLTIEEAAALAGLYKPNVVARVERGQKNLILKAARLINAYRQDVIVKLEERGDD